ncbi:MAG TPA: hypothetical protein VLK27_08285 [Chthoniobacterales bacterium]|nr:hypothetical protein [Chthoniobacterales bacterium]
MNKSGTKSGFFNPRVLLGFVLCLAGASLGLLAFGAGSKQTFANTRNLSLKAGAVVPILSPALRDLPTVTQATAKQTEIGDSERRLVGRQVQDPTKQDPIVKNAAAAANMPAVGASFEGMNIDQACGGCLPPDTDGAVGPNHYVQMVNSDLAVFNKTTGAMISGPTPINHLWSSGECAANNDGDPIVIYDQLADRWLISQFIASAAPSYAQCIAISTSPDPTGTYYAYEFDQSTTVFHDYPKLAVWPDAYYMTSNEFPSSQETNSGAGEFAFERPKMLLGQPARFIWFDSSNLAIGAAYVPGGQNPTNLDGKVLPPAGAPNYIVEVDALPSTPDPTNTSAVLVMWKFHVDWNNPANSTLGTGSGTPTPVGGGLYTAAAGHPDFQIPIANFIAAQCVYGQGPNCVPEKIVPGLNAATLDTLGDRTMFRVTYRNFGDHESMVVHHTVVTAADAPNGATRDGLRWYEVRNLSTTPTIYQQSTFAPLDPTNPLWRWMGSAAMDHMGDIAIGYSASGPNYYPSIHYAGRLSTDPLNDLTQGEAVMFAGLGIQGYPLNRWGDYSDLTVDPNDDCTFWYTQEYAPTNPTPSLIDVSWHTRIGTFKFSQCSVNVPPLLTVSSRKVHGVAGTFDVNLPLIPPFGIEPRSGGANGNHVIVFHFANPVISCGTASTSAGTAANDAASSGNDCVVDLTGVANAQYVTVTLTGTVDDHGNQGNVPITFGVLAGDTTGSGAVNSSDVAQTQSQSGQPVTATNFREDVTVNGSINSSDVGLVQSKSGTALP